MATSTDPAEAPPPATGHRPPHARRHDARRVAMLFGPAFVAAVAYVDPGNVAANVTAGSRFGYLLLWVLIMANAMAVLIQYLSAKLGLVTGMSLSEVLGARLGTVARRAFWLQAEVAAAATDVAEVIGGAIALHLLFGLPLPVGGLITGVVSMAVLAVGDRRGQRRFELLVVGLLLIIAIGFTCGLLFVDVSPGALLAGIVPRFEGAQTLLLAAGMLGATVMPHAIYVHSALARDRHRTDLAQPGPSSRAPRGPAMRRLLRATKWDVAIALVIAGGVNIALLVLAAAALHDVPGTDTIEGAHHAIETALGPAVGTVFAVGLLASGLASTSVGSAAGAEIMQGLLRVRIPLLARRIITLAPAVALLATGADPTYALILSQVVLSFCIPFALIPLVRYTSRQSMMGAYRSGPAVRAAAWATVTVIAALNIALLALTALGVE
ncbi:Nramp family divalent metal transporter [Tomitella fengzijianii]|uniref:Mn(2+) uptake NRAMP transporter MntH n=1 Tax=Tomitella fengzijianii TaxID=2597660 RepID=A0A516X513_9ACTN|nr:Nramp family divalent metal transporter [Tomitella fengzijianii]QDQ98144.1 Mn(2+) uptake NRAMP transporter MntH [Tomitella fengzijianii]